MTSLYSTKRTIIYNIFILIISMHLRPIEGMQQENTQENTNVIEDHQIKLFFKYSGLSFADEWQAIVDSIEPAQINTLYTTGIFPDQFLQNIDTLHKKISVLPVPDNKHLLKLCNLDINKYDPTTPFIVSCATCIESPTGNLIPYVLHNQTILENLNENIIKIIAQQITSTSFNQRLQKADQALLSEPLLSLVITPAAAIEQSNQNDQCEYHINAYTRAKAFEFDNQNSTHAPQASRCYTYSAGWANRFLKVYIWSSLLINKICAQIYYRCPELCYVYGRGMICAVPMDMADVCHAQPSGAIRCYNPQPASWYLSGCHYAHANAKLQCIKANDKTDSIKLGCARVNFINPALLQSISNRKTIKKLLDAHSFDLADKDVVYDEVIEPCPNTTCDLDSLEKQQNFPLGNITTPSIYAQTQKLSKAFNIATPHLFCSCSNNGNQASYSCNGINSIHIAHQQCPYGGLSAVLAHEVARLKDFQTSGCYSKKEMQCKREARLDILGALALQDPLSLAKALYLIEHNPEQMTKHMADIIYERFNNLVKLLDINNVSLQDQAQCCGQRFMEAIAYYINYPCYFSNTAHANVGDRIAFLFNLHLMLQSLNKQLDQLAINKV